MSGRPTLALELAVQPLLRALLGDVSTDLTHHGELDSDVWESAILDPARSILSRTGKGIRARLVEHAWALAGGAPGHLPRRLSICIEVIHAGSLVIDDIEDDSRERRGAPTLHRTHGVPLALNTGNWLYFLGADLILDLPLSAEVRLGLVQDVMRAMRRCHEGQALDISVHIGSARKGTLEELVETATRLKTGSLMELAARMGARGAGGGSAAVAAIGAFGAEVGVGLQMVDDWSGLASPARRDKGIEDLRLGRPTWPWVWLAKSADDLAFREATRQVREISLDWQAEGLLERLRIRLEPMARKEISGCFDRAIEGLGEAFGWAPAVQPVAEDVRAIASAYS